MAHARSNDGIEPSTAPWRSDIVLKLGGGVHKQGRPYRYYDPNP